MEQLKKGARMRAALAALLSVFGLVTALYAAGPITLPNADGYCWDVPTALSSTGKCCHRDGTAIPNGTLTVVNACDDYKQVIPGDPPVYWDAGPIGSTSWNQRLVGAGGGGGCGNGVVDQPSEQCDAPGGVGAQGVCLQLSHCQPNCTCSPPSTCGNGMLDAGEACDPSSDEGDCPPSQCTADCKCDCVCGDGNRNAGCTTGVDETCDAPESSGGSGVDFGNAALFLRNGCSSGSNGCATLRDSSGNRNGGYGLSWDYATAGQRAFTCMEKVTLTSLPTGTQRIIYNGGNNDFTPGHLSELVVVASDVRVGAEFSPDSVDDTPDNNSVLVGTTNLAINTPYTIFYGQNAAGTTANIYLSNPTTGVVSIEATATITAFTAGSQQRFTIGGNATSTSALDGVRVDDVACFDAELSSAQMNALVAAEVPTTAAALSLLVDFDEALASRTISSKASAIAAQFQLCDGQDAIDGGTCDPGTGCTTNCTGTVALVSSPFTTGTGGGGSTGVVPDNCSVACGCPANQVCGKVNCTCQETQTSGGATRYVDPASGNDSNPGTSVSPWRTIPWATCGNGGCNNPNQLKQGDELVLKDGTYPGATISCGVNANNGTQQEPITIRAENERRALFSVDGTRAPFVIENCSWWIVQGLRARTADNVNGDDSSHTFFDNRNTDVIFRRNLADNNNRCRNVHDFKSVGSQRTLFEENEAWNHSRHAFSCTGSDRVIYRRNYVNGNNVSSAAPADCGGDTAVPRGGTSKESFALYPCSNAFIENNLVEGPQDWGINIEGTSGDFGGQRPGSNNLVAGNVIAGVNVGAKIFSRCNATGCSETRGIFNNILRNNLFADMVSGGSFGIRDSVSVQTLYDNNAIYSSDNTSPGMQVDDPCTSPPCGAQLACSQLTQGPASVTITDNLFCGNAGPGLNVAACSGAATRLCTLTNNRSNNSGTNYQNLAGACAGSGGDQCNCTDGPQSQAACTGFGTTGADCVVAPIGGLGPDIRCKLTNGVPASGASASLWCPNTTVCPGATSTCTGTTPQGAVVPCIGGPSFCGAAITGVNDGSVNCRTYGERRLNQDAAQGAGSACPAATFACP